MIEVKGTIVGNQGTIQSSEVSTKETVVGSLGNTKQSLKGATNVAGFYTSDYELPIASDEVLGGIMVGDNLTIEEDGRLNAVVPTKASELENDSGYITKIPNDYVTEEELANKGYLTKVPSAYKTKEENDKLYQPIGDYALNENIPTKVGDLENDIGYITEVPSEYITEEELATSLSTKADKTDIPTKTSQLTNDSGFLTKIPSEYVTESELDSKGYLTEHQDISHLATKSELHTHSNKTILDSITQDNVDKWNAGSRNVVLSPSEPTMGEDIWFQKSVNLFNKETATNTGYIQADGTIYKRSNYYATDYIEVTPGQQYTYSGLLVSTNGTSICHAYYDKNKKLVNTFPRGTPLSVTLTIPDGVHYIRFSLYYYGTNVKDELHTFQFEKGSTASEYQPYADGEKIYTKTKDGYEEFEVGSSGGVVEESDPTVPAHVKAITQADIDKWNTPQTGGGNNIIVDGDGAIISTEESNGVYMWVHNSETFTLQKDTITKIPFDTVVSDTSNGKLIHENGGIRIGKGVKQILVLTKWNTWKYECQKYVYVYKNGVLHEASGFPTGVWTANVVSYVDVQEGDFIETYGYHNYSSSMSISSNSAQTGLKVIVLSETTNVEVVGETPAVILYESESDVSCDVTLSESLANFKYVEIFYSYLGNTWGYDYTKIYQPDGKLTNLSVNVLNNGYIYTTTSTWSLSGNTITKTKGERWRLGTSPNITRSQNAVDIVINKVIGYYEESSIISGGGTSITIHSGTTEPDATVGKDGDIYIKYS